MGWIHSCLRHSVAVCLSALMLCVGMSMAWGATPTNQWFLDANNNALVSISQNVAVSSTNSSTANLASAASFTGTTSTTLGVGSIQVSLFTDQNATIQVQQSGTDPGVNWDTVDSWTYTANSTGADSARTVQATGASFRVIVTNNGGSTTTAFRLTSVVCPMCDALPRGLTQLGNLKVAVQESQGALLTGHSHTSAATITLTATALQFLYITGIEISNCATGTAVVAAAPTYITTTNLNGAPQYQVGSGVTAGLCQPVHFTPFASPLRSQTAGTNVTVVLPTFATNQVISVNVYYYSAP